MITFRESTTNPYVNALLKDKRLVPSHLSNPKTKKVKSTAKKAQSRQNQSSIRVSSSPKKGVKTNQKVLQGIFSGDSTSLNSNLQMKSPKFLAQVQRNNQRYNEQKENDENLPQLSQRRICFQKLIENECDSGKVEEEEPINLPKDERMKSKCHEVRIVEPKHPRKISSDLASIAKPKGSNPYLTTSHRHSKSLIESKSKMIDIGCLLNLEKKATLPCYDNAKLKPHKFSQKTSPSKQKFIKK